MLVERWTLDEFALPGRLVAELATEIVRENRFVRGTLEVAGRSAVPARLTAPLLCVLDRRCRLAPPESVLPFVEAVASRAKTLIDYEGDVGVALQHVGPLVGRNAHELLWPRIVEWTTRLDLAQDVPPRAAFNSMSR
jgi:polyhydroxyalkanoate synthase